MRKVGVGLLSLALVAAAAIVALGAGKHAGSDGRVTPNTLSAPAAPAAAASPSATPTAAPKAKKAAASPTPAPTINPKHKTAGATPGCGETITKSIHLTTNLANCAGDGLIIGAKDVTIDLSGYSIGGVKADHSVGIRNPKAYSGVTIRDGTIQGFDDGIVITARARRRIRSRT